MERDEQDVAGGGGLQQRDAEQRAARQVEGAHRIGARPGFGGRVRVGRVAQVDDADQIGMLGEPRRGGVDLLARLAGDRGDGRPEIRGA